MDDKNDNKLEDNQNLDNSTNIGINYIEEEEEPKKNHREIYLFLFLLVLLVSGLSTLSFAFYRQYLGDGSGDGFGGGSHNADNSIITGDVLFSYSDTGSTTLPDGTVAPANGIYITNAMPMADELGKVMMGNRTYFDFNVVGNARDNQAFVYQVILEKLENSTLEDESVKVYVTTREGNNEVAVPETIGRGGVKLYNQFDDYKGDDFSGKLLFERTIDTKNYNESYRLRLWVGIDARDYQNKQFSAKVNLRAFSK